MRLQVVEGYILRNMRIQRLEVSARVNVVLECQPIDLLVATKAVKNRFVDSSSELLYELDDLEQVGY